MILQNKKYSNLKDFSNSRLSQHTQLLLDFKWNKVDEGDAELLTSSLKECENLLNLTLQLSLNKITANGTQSLWEGLKMIKNLHNLTIDLKVKGANCAKGLDSGFINTSIMVLKVDLRWNKIGQNGLMGLKKAFKSCVNLSSLELQLSKNNLSVNEMIKITRLIPKLNKLVLKQITIE
ncbi:hypothetical protein ABPG73_008304 [Tetrahymena malaccensis]